MKMRVSSQYMVWVYLRNTIVLNDKTCYQHNIRGCVISYQHNTRECVISY